MPSDNHFYRVDHGQLVPKSVLEMTARVGDSLTLPALKDINDQDDFLVPVAVVRQYWT